MFGEAGAQMVSEHPREFETEYSAMRRQLELAMRETYFHPSKVPASVMGDEEQAMPQQQQQLVGLFAGLVTRPSRLGVRPGGRQ